MNRQFIEMYILNKNTFSSATLIVETRMLHYYYTFRNNFLF